MGLDMYLYTFEPEVRDDVINLEKLSDQESDNLWSKTEEVAYWRKANFLHGFFCENAYEIRHAVFYLVSRSLLEDFISKASQVLNKRSKAYSSKHLPTYSGFFFGSYGYDDDYYEYVEEVMNSLKTILKEHEDNEFLYYAWW